MQVAIDVPGHDAASPPDWPGVGKPAQSTVAPRQNAGATAWLRVHLAYLWRHRRPLSLDAPTRFTELVQRRKLLDHDLRLPLLTDKLEAKRLVAGLLGEAWVTPTLWSGTTLPSTPLWPRSFVVKSRHGCNQSRFVRDGAENWEATRRTAARWMSGDYGRWLDEWGYRGIPRGLLAEPFVGGGPTLPIDYKLYVFHGRVEFIQVHLDREHDHRWLVLDRYWRRVSSLTADPDPRPPRCLAHMIEGAEVLGCGFDFVRVDLYDVGGRPRFGEMSFYPGSGLDPFDPSELDVVMGTLWLGGPAPEGRS